MITRARASALLFGGAAVCALGRPLRAQTAATIRIAGLRIESAAQLYYAKDMGFFAKAGLDADIQAIPGGSAAIVAAIEGGAIDIGYSAVDTLATIHQKNIPVVIIAPANEYVSPGSQRTTALVLPANSQVQKAKDLSGKTFAVAGFNTVADIAPRVWIDQNGGDSSAVKFVEVPFPAMTAALDAGRVDAAWVAEPFIGPATKNGRAIAYGFDGISKHFIVSAWFTTPQWAKDHPDLVKRFAGVMRDTADWANTNPGKSGEILAKYTGLDPAVIATMARTRYGNQLTAPLTQPLIDVAAKYGKFSPFPATELIYAVPR
jgi:NitT/TauT family transport system substrate-binding protein